MTRLILSHILPTIVVLRAAVLSFYASDGSYYLFKFRFIHSKRGSNFEIVLVFGTFSVISTTRVKLCSLQIKTLTYKLHVYFCQNMHLTKTYKLHVYFCQNMHLTKRTEYDVLWSKSDILCMS